MIPKQKIRAGQYWDDSLTLVSGCSPVSEGCEHCWSARQASRFDWGKPYAENGKWTGVVEPNWKALEKLEKRAASTRKLKPRVYQIWNDFFHPKLNDPNACTDKDFQLRCWDGMIRCTQDIFLILTKHPDQITQFEDWEDDGTTDHIYVGVSVESQKHIHRIDQLIQNWQGKKFVSIEPCLESVNMTPKQLAALDQVIIGGESGAKARPMHPDWARSIRDQCVEAGVPFFFKQWGEYIPCWQQPAVGPVWMGQMNAAHFLHGKSIESGKRDPDPENELGDYSKIGKKNAGRLLDGHTYDQLAWSKGDTG